LKVGIIYNKDFEGVINRFGIVNKETYNINTVQNVYKALESEGHNVAVIDGNMHVIEQLQEFMPRVLEGERMGMVFNMAYGIQGESRYTHIPAMLEMLGIPYVGSNPSGHALALDKVYTKIIMQKNNIPTPDFWVFNSENEDISEVDYPCIVKPKMESVSFGLKVVNNKEELKEAINYLKDEFKQQILVEKFISGREFCVGLLGNSPVESFPILEIDLNNNPYAIQTYEDKIYTPKNKICPANISKELGEKMTNLSISAFKALGLRDFARVDIRLDNENNIYLLEINSMASLGATGSYVNAAKKAGYSFNELVNKMLDVAAERYFSNNILFNDMKNSDVLTARIRSFLNSKKDNLDKILREFVNINTYVRNVEGINKFSDMIKKHLVSLGFYYKSIPQIEVGNFLLFSNTEKQKYDILFLGNLDNPTQVAKHKYFVENDQKLFGTGIWEHKGGIVMLIGALQALRYTRNLKKIKIGILLTSDDSLQGSLSKDLIISESNKAKIVIGIHGSSPTGGFVISRSGSAVYHCHMNLIKTDKAENVAFATSTFTKIINKWVELSDVSKGVIVSPSELSIKSNITEPYANGEVTLSVRFNNTESMQTINERIKKIISNKYKGILDFQITGGIRRPSLTINENTRKIIDIMKGIAKKMDIRFLQEHRWSSADICFVEKEIPLIDGIGPIGVKPQNDKEYILKHSLVDKAAFLAVAMCTLKDE
jgi:D-alanine-D-alanine ligase